MVVGIESWTFANINLYFLHYKHIVSKLSQIVLFFFGGLLYGRPIPIHCDSILHIQSWSKSTLLFLNFKLMQNCSCNSNFLILNNLWLMTSMLFIGFRQYFVDMDDTVAQKVSSAPQLVWLLWHYLSTNIYILNFSSIKLAHSPCPMSAAQERARWAANNMTPHKWVLLKENVSWKKQKSVWLECHMLNFVSGCAWGKYRQNQWGLHKFLLG